jgi:hypothetical protein
MTTSVYPIYRATGRPIQFKGLKGQFILIAAAGLIGDLFLFILLYCCRAPAWLCVAIALGGGTGVLSTCIGFSRKYGVHGLKKLKARRRLPRYIRCRSRQSFTK